MFKQIKDNDCNGKILKADETPESKTVATRRSLGFGLFSLMVKIH